MPRASRLDRVDPPWLTLGEASRLLGVSAPTVRRWSDAGRLRTFTTPGGHRRFSRAALERMLPADRERRPSLSAAGLTPTRLSRAYGARSAHAATRAGWLAALDPTDRQVFGDLGRRLAWALVAYLDSADPTARTLHLSEATAAAREYGRLGTTLGLSLSDVVEGFLAFRRPFLAEIGAVASRRGFDGDEIAGLHDDADTALDRLLIATMSGHRMHSTRRSRRAVAIEP